MKTLFFTFFLITAFSIPTMAGHHKGEGGGRGIIKRAMKELSLSDEQKSQLKEVRKAHKGQMKEMRKKRKSLHKEFNDMMMGSANDDALRSKHSELQTVRMELAKKRFERRLAVRKVLTEAQRKELFAKMKDSSPE